jgi:dGTPase
MLDGMDPDYRDNQPAVMVRDFIAGMTDDYFLKEAAAYGCEIPEKI